MQVEMEGLLVFILEADASTAIELDAIAAHLGCRKISAFHYCEIADRWLDHFTPDLAIVDPCVDQGGCVSVLARLDHADVPLVLYSNLPPSGTRQSSRTGGVVHIPNPSPPHVILTAMESVLAGRDGRSLEMDIVKHAGLFSGPNSRQRRPN